MSFIVNPLVHSISEVLASLILVLIPLVVHLNIDFNVLGLINIQLDILLLLLLVQAKIVTTVVIDYFILVSNSNSIHIIMFYYIDEAVWI